MDNRYELIAGDINTRRTIYLVRRKLHFTREEWEDLSWAEQRMYLEGLEEEFRDDEEGGSSGTPTAPPSEPDWAAFDNAVSGARTRRAGRGD